MGDNSVVDLVATAVLERVGHEVEQRVSTAVEQARDEVQRQINDLLVAVPGQTIEPPPTAKADAKDRASRTMLQGAVATILVAGILAVANGLGDDGFDFTSGGDWKAIAGAALAAMIMAGGAFVQRLVNPPRGQ